MLLTLSLRGGGVFLPALLAMIYTQFTLTNAFFVAGFFLLFLGVMALARHDATEKWMLRFPRSRAWGRGLLIVAAAWAWLLVYNIDLGEFAKYQNMLLIVVPAAAILTGLYVEELLAARALGMVVLLAAEPLLEAAFLRPEASRLFLVTFTYVAIVAGMFWIGMPYVLRDHFRWLTLSPVRLRGAAIAAVAYGAVLLISGLTLHR